MIGFQAKRKSLPQRVTFYPVPVTQVAISSTRVAVLGKKMRYYFSPRSATIKAPRRNQPRKTMKQVNITVTTYGAPDAASLKQDARSVLFVALLERIGELNKEEQQNVSSSKNIL